ncbi:MAG: hypothetical protein P9L99_13010 [Candidatus Lernaella stagnicola]|nr:hypothetical protein [Candidatus Lernaella stagnicola]
MSEPDKPQSRPPDTVDPKPHIREKSATCPVCGEHTLRGYFVDLPSGKIDYSHLFLPVLRDRYSVEGAAALPNLTLLDNYICTNDLYCYVGKVDVHETRKGTRFDLTPNDFYKGHVYLKSDREAVVGRRLAFFLGALQYSSLDAREILPPEDTDLQYDKIETLVRYLLDVTNDNVPLDHERTYRVFHTLATDLEWNIVAPAMRDLLISPKLAGAMMELQLADLLYLHRRTAERNRTRIDYPDLYDTLHTYRELCRAGESLDDLLAGNVLFQCLKMAEHFVDQRRFNLLHIAFDISAYQVRVKSRMGSDINRNLDKLAGNADVMLYLNVRLARDLGVDNPQEEAAIRLLRRRLETIGDYAFAGRSKDSVSIARLGSYLKKFVADL